MAEPNSDWWRTWFGPRYLALYDETLTERTPAEIDRLEALLQLRPPRRILDLPCGQGRHAIELARRGYEVTGMDISPYLIEIARQRARAADVQVRWLTGDMRQPIPGAQLEAAMRQAGFRRVDLHGDWGGESLQRDRSIAIVAVGSIG